MPKDRHFIISEFIIRKTLVYWRRKWQPTPVFFGNSMDRGAWWAIYSMGLQRVGHDLATERIAQQEFQIFVN